MAPTKKMIDEAAAILKAELESPEMAKAVFGELVCDVCGHEHYLLCEVVITTKGDICLCDVHIK